MKVIELFAGVGGFRIGLERASKEMFDFVWSNQFEPSTKRQDASDIYRLRFGDEGHSNVDINLVPTDEIPDHDLLVGGFPCQDYSVATTLNLSSGIEGKKGVLWWQIYRILLEKGEKRPQYLLLENVDRLLKSPSTQRGRDFAIILTSLCELGYDVEWRIIDASEYGMPQRRKRTYILCYRKGSDISNMIGDRLEDGWSVEKEWLSSAGLFAKAFPCYSNGIKMWDMEGTTKEVSDGFNKENKDRDMFFNAGLMRDGHVVTANMECAYEGDHVVLGDVLVDDKDVPDEFFIKDETELERWKYAKGPKKFERMSKDGHPYVYSEGGMSFPDALDKPSRTIITGEGGKAVSRFKHVIKTSAGRYRRLMPIELERLNMFPDNHTEMEGVSDVKRAFLMGNALVCGIVERIGLQMKEILYEKG